MCNSKYVCCYTKYYTVKDMYSSIQQKNILDKTTITILYYFIAAADVVVNFCKYIFIQLYIYPIIYMHPR